MDYEKKYKEVLENAKHYHREMGDDVCCVLEEIFPELKESGDEVKESLIDYFNNFHLQTFAGLAPKKILDWLEKQGEKLAEPNWCHHKVDLSDCSEEYRKAYYDGWNNCNMQHSQCNIEKNDVIKCLINGMRFYYEDNEEATWGTDKWSMPVKHIIEVLEKQSEQPRYNIGDVLCDKLCTTLNKEAQPNIEVIDIRNGMYICDKCSFPISQQDEYELVAKNTEQKPAEWNEKDEEIVKALNDYVKNLDTFFSEIKIGDKDILAKEFREKVQHWLKSLKDRVKPKQEWSEEDEQHFNFLEKLLEILQVKSTENEIKKGTTNNSQYYYEVIQWLKSLRHQRNVGYNPYKAVVESIAEMCEKYKGYVVTKEVANDFLNNVFAKCHEAVEYDKKYPQKQWKPSEEQIHWLKWAINRLPDTEKANEAECELNELLEQLKQL